MKELISIEQANKLMYVVLVAAPLIGLAIGAINKRLIRGLMMGVVVGVANLVMWRVYNAITDHLGLDTVKNLFVNMALFVVVGIVAGIVWARFGASNEATAATGPSRSD